MEHVTLRQIFEQITVPDLLWWQWALIFSYVVGFFAARRMVKDHYALPEGQRIWNGQSNPPIHLVAMGVFLCAPISAIWYLLSFGVKRDD